MKITGSKYILIDRFRRIKQLLDSIPLQSGISHSEFCVMNIIAEKDGITVSEIAAELGVSPPAVSRSLKFMENRTLITREANMNNRRNTIVKLTNNGRETLEITRKQFDEIADFINLEMGEERKKQLYGLVTEISEIIEKYVNTKGDSTDD